MTNTWLVHSTFLHKSEAISVARNLLERRLIACANLAGGLVSLYRWEGVVQQEEETLLMVKTQASQVDAVIAAIKSLHSYELPCIVAFPLAKGHAPFLQWVEEEASGISP